MNIKAFWRGVRSAIRHLYVALHSLLVIGILIGAGILYIVFRPDGLDLLKTYLFSPLGIEFESSESSLVEGVNLRNLHSESIDIKTLSLDYNLSKIVQGRHVIDSIRIDGLRIHLEDFISEDDSDSFPLPTFVLKEVVLTNLQLISAYPIELDIRGENGSFDGKKLNFKNVSGSVRSQYASGAVRGTLKNDIFIGTGVAYPNALELDPYLADSVTLPKFLNLEIRELSASRALVSTKLSSLQALFDPKLSLENVVLKMAYQFSNGYIDFDATYRALRDENKMATHQSLRYDFEGVTTTSFEGNLDTPLPLPSRALSGNFRNDSAGLAGKVMLGSSSSLSIQSSDYNRYQYGLFTNQQNLEFLNMLPIGIQNSLFKLEAKGEYRLKENTLSGNFSAHHNHGDVNGTLSLQEKGLRIQGGISLFPDAPTWKDSSLKPPPHLEFTATQKDSTKYLSVNGDDLALSIREEGGKVEGSGNYLETFFEIEGIQGEKGSDVSVTSLTPSLLKTLSALPSFVAPKSGYYDAEVRTKTRIVYDSALHISSEVNVPWYAAVVDSTHQYSGVNNTLKVHSRDGNISINSYSIDIADHRIETQTPSLLHVNSSGKLQLDEVWIYDALLLTGEIDPASLESSLHLSSDRFSYSGPEGEAHAAIDVRFERDSNASQKLFGEITLLDGKITYLPLQQLKVMDDDVIIIQDVRAPSNSTLAMNVRVTAQKPLQYLTKELDLHMIPDFTLWKDPQSDMQILGMMSIPKGVISTNNKTFTLRPSFIYFGGDVPLNPYLDITLDYEVDYKKIEIYVTHRLDSPIFLFNSDPFMNQNDIMSYILFGTSASSALSTSSSGNVTAKADATNFMLGAGLKGLVSSTTKIQLDTMNILTTQEGGMGFEVGARLNKDFRVLYKNDTISSVLIQYTVNRWLRLDADIHELGQGINVIYIKDFRDFLPHNPPRKR